MADLNFEEERIFLTPIILYIDYINIIHNDYLKKNGYIIRRPDLNNKSKKIINLSDEGKLVLFSLMKIVYEWERDFLKDYTTDEVELFKKMLYEYSQKSINSLYPE